MVSERYLESQVFTLYLQLGFVLPSTFVLLRSDCLHWFSCVSIPFLSGVLPAMILILISRKGRSRRGEYSTRSDSDSSSDGDLPLQATSKMALNKTLSISASRQLDGGQLGSNVNSDILREKLNTVRVDSKRFELNFNDDKATKANLTTTKPLDDPNIRQSDEIKTSTEDSADASSESSEEISGDDINVSEDNAHEGTENKTGFSSDHDLN